MTELYVNNVILESMALDISLMYMRMRTEPPEVTAWGVDLEPLTYMN